MAVHVPFRLLLVHRLVSVFTFNQSHYKHRAILVKLCKRGNTRGFSTASLRCKENEGDSSDTLTTKLPSRQGLLLKPRRPLSPLERLSRLLPQEALSPELVQLQEQNQQQQDADADAQIPASQCTQDESGPEGAAEQEEVKTHVATDAGQELKKSSHQEEGQLLPTLPGESLLTFGELLIAEYRKKKRVEFRKMFQLERGVRLQSSWGSILHDDIYRKHAGCFLKTGRGVPILIRRASLEDYVLHMKRGPVIAYPKDAVTMLLMMDVTEGDCVLESGSGSGAMSLFLSRAVGSKGSVLSVEVRDDHHRRAVLNYERWRKSWSLRQGQQWPDNVHFYKSDLCAGSSLLSGQGINAVALDMINPHLALPTVLPHLHPGGVCAVYLANVTQVIDLLEGLRCYGLPLLCERVIEVPLRDWMVVPALQKDGQYCTRKVRTPDEDLMQDDEPDKEKLTEDKNSAPAFGSIPYIARPHPEQMSHTAFLVKLRKCVH
ncbi:tRNA (adenine(58)-N(1))-methyltransferase, mitochondrial [Xenentodon cancila]